MAAYAPFTLDVHDEDGPSPLVSITGDLDIVTAPVLRQLFVDHAAESLTLDLSGVTLIDSTSLGVLVAAHKRAARDGRRIVLRGVPPMQMRLFELTGLTGYINIDPDGAGAAS